MWSKQPSPILFMYFNETIIGYFEDSVVYVCVCVYVHVLSHVRLFATPWTVALQTPLSREFSRREYWSGLPFPSLGDLLSPGIKPGSPALQADCLPSEPLGVGQ